MDRAPARLLFVCIENACRSQMAEGFARMLGGARVEVYSAGSRPSGVVNPKAIASMREIGYDLSGHRSEGLSALPDLVFDYAVTMGCGDECPSVRARNRVDWKIPDPKHLDAANFAEIRDLIGTKVGELLSKL